VSAKSNKRRASGYSVATRRHITKPPYNLSPSGRAGTATLILTPKLIHRFGSVFRAELRVESALLSVSDLYQEALKESLLPVTKSKSVPEFEVRAKKGILTYSKRYDEILYKCASALGESRFKLEYVKQITEVDKEFRDLHFASLDLIRLFRRHVACCTNAATNYEELFESDVNKLYTVDLLLRTSNYGLTVLVLLLNGTLAGPLWVTMELQRLTSDALYQMESMPELRIQQSQLSGSLVFAEGDLDLTPETGKPQ
jgi:hypothetical protein